MTKHSQNISVSVMQLALHYLSSDECLEMPFSQYAKKFIDCSYDHMQLRFKKDVGVNIAVYLIAEKVKMAKKIMNEDHKISLNDISILCRYKHLGHMTNHFKKMEGVTPTEYRNNLNEKKQAELTKNI